MIDPARPLAQKNGRRSLELLRFEFEGVSVLVRAVEHGGKGSRGYAWSIVCHHGQYFWTVLQKILSPQRHSSGTQKPDRAGVRFRGRASYGDFGRSLENRVRQLAFENDVLRVVSKVFRPRAPAR